MTMMPMMPSLMSSQLYAPSQLFNSNAMPLHTEQSQERTEKLRVLVVDDMPDITFLFGMILEDAGYEVVKTYSGYEALEAAQHEQFNFIISDIGMPGMSGYELAAALRALPSYSSVPLVAVTGFTEYDDRDRALAAGFDAHLKKPVDPATLIELVERFH